MNCCSQTLLLQDISAVAKAWGDSPYLFIVKVQPMFRGVDDEEAEQLNFAFTSETTFHSKSSRIKSLLLSR